MDDFELGGQVFHLGHRRCDHQLCGYRVCRARPSVSGHLSRILCTSVALFVFVVSPLLNFMCRNRSWRTTRRGASLGSVCHSINLSTFSFTTLPFAGARSSSTSTDSRQNQPHQEQLPAHQQPVPPRHVLRSEARLWWDVCRTCFTRGFFF